MYNTLKPISLKQKSKKWLDLKRTKIGSSEIYGLVKYYVKDEELESLGINSEEFNETPYTTAWEIWHKFTNPRYTRKSLAWELSEYGNAIEKFSFKWIQKKGNFKYGNCAFKEGGVYSDDDDIRIASLDIEAITDSTEIITDSNGNHIALIDDKEFVVEVKGMSSFKSSKSNILVNGVDWKYILQLQYQIWCTNKNWGVVLVNELLNDTATKRGYIIRCGETMNKKDYEYIDNATKKSMFFYKRLPQYEKIFEIALERFANDVKFMNEPKFTKTNNTAFWIQLLMRRSELVNRKTFDFKKSEFVFIKKDKTINILDGVFDINEIFEGDEINISGTKNNNGLFKVKSVSDNELKLKGKIEDEFNVKNVEIYKKLTVIIREDFDEFFNQYKKRKKENDKYKLIKEELDRRFLTESKLKVESKHGKISLSKSRMTVTLKKD